LGKRASEEPRSLPVGPVRGGPPPAARRQARCRTPGASARLSLRIETLRNLSAIALGGSWNRDGVIIFGACYGIMRVSANGGSASPLTTLDPSRNETLHFLPSFLPYGSHFIYLRQSNKRENSGVYVGSLNAKPEQQSSKLLLATNWGPPTCRLPTRAWGSCSLCAMGR
jgi:hypothetical protein